MTIEFNFYKESGKWYTTEKIVVNTPSDDLDDEIRALIPNRTTRQDMYCQVNILEVDGHIQPYRIFKL